MNAENMNYKKVALAVGAHPDDVEFMMAGTLTLLVRAGYEPHIFSIGNGSCGTVQLSIEEIVQIRRQEAKKAAEIIGAVYHPGLVNDVEIYYEDRLLRKVAALIRELQPEIVLCHSPNDYMEDHQNAARLIVTACFCRGLRNFITDPPLEPVSHDVYIYHANPHGNCGPLRERIDPHIFVDITDVMAVKERMLRCHESQEHWLDVSQGMDSYIHTMQDLSRQRAEQCPDKGVKYAEAFRQRLHYGFSSLDRDRLKEVLGDKVISVVR